MNYLLICWTGHCHLGAILLVLQNDPYVSLGSAPGELAGDLDPGVGEQALGYLVVRAGQPTASFRTGLAIK